MRALPVCLCARANGSDSVTIGCNAGSSSARSARPCMAKVFTIELRSSRYICNSFTTRRRSGTVSRRRGTITARCHLTSFCSSSASKPSSSALCACSSAAFCREAFSIASAARMLMQESESQRHSTSSTTRSGRRATSSATSSDRPMDRRSPPASIDRIVFRKVITISLDCACADWAR